MVRGKYEINRPGETCLMCGKKLQNTSKHRSALTSDEEEQVLLRHDYCPECWEKVKNNEFFSHWLVRREIDSSENKREQRKTRKERAAKLFDDILESDSPDRMPRLFILAHLLLRFKVLNWAGYDFDTETGERFLVFEKVSNREKVRIPSIKLSEEELADAHRFVDSILENKPEPK